MKILEPFGNLLKIFALAQSLAKILIGLMLFLFLCFFVSVCYHNAEVDLRNKIASQKRWISLCPPEEKAKATRRIIELKEKHDIMRQQFPSCLVVGFREEIIILE